MKRRLCVDPREELGGGGACGGGETDGHIQTVCLQNYSTVKTLRAFRQQTLPTDGSWAQCVRSSHIQWRGSLFPVITEHLYLLCIRIMPLAAVMSW